MKSLYNIIASYITTFTLIVLYIFLTALATFIENSYGTPAAKSFIYNSFFFNLLNFLLALNMIAVIIKRKLYSKRKFTIFIFHFGFIIILLGAAITRFLSFSGNMHIREGATSNIIYSTENYVKIKMDNGNNVLSEEIPVKNNYFRKNFKHKLEFFNKEYTIKIDDIITNSINGNENKVYIFDFSDGQQIVKVDVMESDGYTEHATTFKINNNICSITYSPKEIKLPFSLKLDDFILKRYAGSMSPKSYQSDVTVLDPNNQTQKEYSISMNNVLNYKAYRFFQSSYDTDEKGTILSVNHDFWGSLITYIGYILLAIGMFLTLFNKYSRLRYLSKKLNSKVSKASVILVFLLISTVSFSQNSVKISKIDQTHADKFGTLYIKGGTDRIEPVNTFASELLLKLTHKSKFMDMDPNQVLLSMLISPTAWDDVPIIKVSDPTLIKRLNVKNNLVAMSDLFGSDGIYKFENEVNLAYQKSPSARNQLDKDIIKMDEDANILYQILNLSNLYILPDKNSGTWNVPKMKMNDSVLTSGEKLFFNYLLSLQNSTKNNNWKQTDSALNQFAAFQKANMNKELVNESKLKAEIFYYKAAIFRNLFEFYFTIGLFYVAFLFLKILFAKIRLKGLDYFFRYTIYLAFIIHTFGLGLRWYISNHAPWSNGYESMIYISWATLLSGIIFSKKNKLVLAATTVLAGITLLVAHLSWMDPQITNLVPVLQSYWLTFHVAIITASYGFLGLSAILGFLILTLMIFIGKNNVQRIANNILDLTYINEMSLIVGLFLLTLGTFLGGVWANQSWGTYWSWDPKETWSLISILVYMLVLHVRLIPPLKGLFSFNLISLLSISSIIMTFFGVNYYLSGMHSYGAGEAPGVPSFVYYFILTIIVVSVLAYIKYKKFLKNSNIIKY